MFKFLICPSKKEYILSFLLKQEVLIGLLSFPFLSCFKTQERQLFSLPKTKNVHRSTNSPHPQERKWPPSSKMAACRKSGNGGVNYSLLPKCPGCLQPLACSPIEGCLVLETLGAAEHLSMPSVSNSRRRTISLRTDVVFCSASNGAVRHGWRNLSTVKPQLEEVRWGEAEGCIKSQPSCAGRVYTYFSVWKLKISTFKGWNNGHSFGDTISLNFFCWLWANLGQEGGSVGKRPRPPEFDSWNLST